MNKSGGKSFNGYFLVILGLLFLVILISMLQPDSDNYKYGEFLEDIQNGDMP